MKKLFITVVILLFSLVLVSCGGEEGKKDEGITDAVGAKAVYDATVDAYKNATGVDALFTYEDSEGKQTISFKYTLEGSKIKELAYVVANASGELSIYVKDGVAYMNAYGTKSKANMTDDDYTSFNEKYTFATAMSPVNSLFGVSFFTAASVESNESGLVKLTCNLSALAADPALDEDAYFEMEENIEKLQAKKGLNVEMNYEGGQMTKFVGTVTEQDDSTKQFTINFNGNTPSITFPDLSLYEEAK